MVKNLTKIIPSCMSGIFADLTESAIAHPDIFPAKITISFLTSSIPILAMKLKSSSELNPKLILSFTNLLNHATLSQKQLKVKNTNCFKLESNYFLGETRTRSLPFGNFEIARYRAGT